MLHRVATTVALSTACCCSASRLTNAAAPNAAALDVAQLLTTHCLTCHSAGGSAPIRFDSTDAIVRNRQLMRALLEDRSMPPWIPDASSAPMLHERRLSEDARATLLAALANADEARRAFATITPRAICSNPTEIDAQPSHAWIVPASGGMRVRTFSAQLTHEAPRRVRGVRVTDVGSLAHSPLRVLTLAADPTRTLRIMATSGEEGYESMGDVGLTPSGALGELTRVAPHFELPRGFAFELPAGDVVMETTNEPIGRYAPLQPQITFIPADARDTRTVTARTLRIVPLNIGAGEAVIRNAAFTLAKDSDIVGVIVKGGAFLRSMHVEVRDATGCVATIVRMPDFRLSLSEPWLLATPMRVAAGSTIEAQFGFDNTSANPLQPVKTPVDVVGGLPPDGEDASVVILLSEVAAE